MNFEENNFTCAPTKSQSKIETYQQTNDLISNQDHDRAPKSDLPLSYQIILLSDKRNIHIINIIVICKFVHYNVYVHI